MNIGAVILCGGKSRRMGSDKAMLTFDGLPFLERLLHELSDFDELLISVDSPENHSQIKLPTITDIYPDCGPMGGLHAALNSCKAEALLTLSCDMPLFRRELAEYLCAELAPDADAVVPLTSDGRMHPLCAVYRKSTVPIFETLLRSGNFRMRDALKKLSVRYVTISDTPYSEKYLQNVNTPAEFDALLKQEG